MNSSRRIKLAIRLAQKGCANFYYLRSQYTNRVLLDTKDDVAFENRFSSALSPNTSYDDALRRVSEGRRPE